MMNLFFTCKCCSQIATFFIDSHVIYYVAMLCRNTTSHTPVLSACLVGTNWPVLISVSQVGPVGPNSVKFLIIAWKLLLVGEVTFRCACQKELRACGRPGARFKQSTYHQNAALMTYNAHTWDTRTNSASITVCRAFGAVRQVVYIYLIRISTPPPRFEFKLNGMSQRCGANIPLCCSWTDLCATAPSLDH
jgi:hypothetical protein